MFGEKKHFKVAQSVFKLEITYNSLQPMELISCLYYNTTLYNSILDGVG